MGYRVEKTHGLTTKVVVGFRCAHCGRSTGNFAGGFSRGHDGQPLCHPNAPNRPDCYHLVTVYHHETPCKNSICFEDHEDKLVYINSGKKKRTKK